MRLEKGVSIEFSEAEIDLLRAMVAQVTMKGNTDAEMLHTFANVVGKIQPKGAE
jgi:hypothetical protein